MDRITAIKAISREIRDLILDATPASLAASHMDFLALVQPVTNQLQGKDSYIYSGAGAGQGRIVTSFLPANNRVIYQEVFTTLPSTNSNVLIFDHFRKDEYDAALDRLLGMAKLKFLEEKTATLSIVATQYEYPVPSGLEYISTLRMVPSGSSDYDSDDYTSRLFEFSPRYWRIEANPLGTFVISFDRRKLALDDFDKDWLRVMGQAKPSIGGTDNATIPEDLEEYVVNGASMLLASQRISEGREWQAKFYMFRDIHRDLEEYVFRHPRGKRVG